MGMSSANSDAATDTESLCHDHTVDCSVYNTTMLRLNHNLGYSAMRLKAGVFGVVVCLVATFSGCGSSSGPKRASVSGTVKLDGTPIERGVLSLVPTGDTKGPTAGAEVVNGKYSIAEAGGPVLGQYRVEITASRKTGRTRDEGGMVGKIEETEQYLPAKYNTASELKLEVKAGSNKGDFDLTSK